MAVRAMRVELTRSTAPHRRRHWVRTGKVFIPDFYSDSELLPGAVEGAIAAATPGSAKPPTRPRSSSILP